MKLGTYDDIMRNQFSDPQFTLEEEHNKVLLRFASSEQNRRGAATAAELILELLSSDSPDAPEWESWYYDACILAYGKCETVEPHKGYITFARAMHILSIPANYHRNLLRTGV